MGWYRRSSRFISDAFRCYGSKIAAHRNSIQESISGNSLYTSSFRPKSRVSEFSQPIFRNSALHNGWRSPFLDGAKRFYYVDRNEVYHFKPRGYKRWIQNPRNVLAIVLVGSGVVITVYSPESVGLPIEAPEHETIKALSDRSLDGEQWHDEDKWRKEDEILDDQWVQMSRRKGQEKGMVSQTGHLEGLKWEVLVVNEPVINAFCLPGGKIVVFTGLLNHFRADAEIATVIGHEVGHVVARHSAEQISKNLWLTILQLILYQFFMPDIVNTMSNLFLRLPFSRRMEMEADYIGLLLVASAGYDPRVAPQVYEKLGRITGSSALQDYLATHPSGKKRAQVLAQAKVMEEALTIYREVQAGRGVEGFL
ncbi:UNVERIFIED_CONTAM: Mitochondrial metalloendopeptidase OMA1 [Sesamum angustifolium]|uniref:Mitochondrial metalloendopeptidase OMA1 n=1 Tax=Sesamum angustifolium TaxID=2727405 RepID=A0AAW2PUB7_9LAMI